MNKLIIAIGAALLFCGGLVLAQINRPTATLEGGVAKAGTSDVLPDVQVGLVAENGSKSTVVTGPDGKFSFKDLSPGRYTIDVVRSGFVKPVRPLQPINLSLDPGNNTVQLQMVATAAVSGRVLDSDGIPVRGALVLAGRPEYSDGHRFVWTCNTATMLQSTTNEHGEYRLFGFIPAEYYLVVSPNGNCNIENSLQFYPGVGSPTDAMPVRLQAGSDWGGMDFRLSHPVLHAIRFKIIQPDSIVRRIGFLGIMVTVNQKTRTGLDFLMQVQVSQISDGVYQTRPLPSGSYDLYYQPVIGEVRMAQLSVDIGNRNGDVDAGAFVIRETKLTCAARMDPLASGTPPPAFTMDLRPSGSQVSQFLHVRFPIKEDGSCSLLRYPVYQTPSQEMISQGNYEIGINGLPADLYVESAKLDGQNVQNMHVVLDREMGKLELTLARGGIIEGTVRNRKSEPVANSEVALVPATSLRDHWNLYKTAVTDQHGAFIIRGIAPGEYRALARDDAEAGAYLDPAFMAPFDQQGVKITVGQGTSVIVNVPQIIYAQ